jgi:hypothetical protein
MRIAYNKQALKQGRLAQLVELLPYKQAVTGSSPVPSILDRHVVFHLIPL